MPKPDLIYTAKFCSEYLYICIPFLEKIAFSSQMPECVFAYVPNSRQPQPHTYLSITP